MAKSKNKYKITFKDKSFRPQIVECLHFGDTINPEGFIRFFNGEPLGGNLDIVLIVDGCAVLSIRKI